MIEEYFKNARLIINPLKTEVYAFHLNNKEAERKLQFIFKGEELRHNFKPKYLGIILDRSLTFKSHIDTLSMKLRTRLNVIRVLAGTDWGAFPETLRTSTIALMSGTINYTAVLLGSIVLMLAR